MPRLFIAALVAIATAPAFAGPVNINTASVAELDTELVGVGPVLAQRIVEHRLTHGEFNSADALVEVKGIGAKTFAKNRESILVE